MSDDYTTVEEFAEEFEIEAPAADLIKFAVDKYTASGYEGISDCLFALLCDITGLYANKTRTPGCPRHISLDGIHESVINNIAPEYDFTDDDEDEN